MLRKLASLSALAKRYPLLGHYVCAVDRPFPTRRYKRYRKTLRSNQDILPSGARHLGSLMHDSWIKSCEFTAGRLTLTVNDFCCHCLCDALVQATGLRVPERSRVMPVELCFENVTNCAYYCLDYKRIVACDLRDDARYLSEFLYERV
jgi:hypothetical protein